MPDFFLHVYNELKNIYNSDSNKELNKQYVVKKLCDYFQAQKSALSAYKLKVLMEAQFIRDIKCQYTYLITPEKYGCDLRELIFNYLSEEQKSAALTNIVKNRINTINHIITDIDDTIFPNYNGFLETFGSDTSWVSNKLYPGIAKFYEHFYKTLPLKESRYSTILSGTPLFLKNARLHNNKIQSAIGSDYGVLHGFDNKRQLLRALVVGMSERPLYNFAPSSNHLAEIKFKRYTQYKQLFPEYRMLVIGDNGQGDLAAGIKILNTDDSALIFIHNIMRYKTHFIFSEDDEQKFKHERLYFFKNYLELSVIFFKLNIFKFKDLKSIHAEIRAELNKQYSIDKSPCLYNHFSTNLIPKIFRISNTGM